VLFKKSRIVCSGESTISFLLLIVKRILRNLSDLEVKIIYRLFRAKIAEQKKLRNLTNADMAKLTGYTKSTIDAFMCGVRESENVAKAIAEALDIEI
jgi:hypothetical protein